MMCKDYGGGGYPNASFEAHALAMRLEDKARCQAIDAAKAEFGDGDYGPVKGDDGAGWGVDAWRVRREMFRHAAELALRDRARPIRIGLVSCAKRKRSHPSPARELYAESALFRRASNYCRREYDHWYVLSAKYGLVHPDTVIAPYDVTLRRMSVAERRAWGQQVSAQLRRLPEATFYAHAGKCYVEPLEGVEIINVLAGYAIGQRLRWYKEREERHDKRRKKVT